MVVVGNRPPSSSTDVWLCTLCRVADFSCSTCFHTTFWYTSNGYSGWFGPSSPVVFLLSCCPVCPVVTLYDQLPPAHKHYCTYTTDRDSYTIHLSSLACATCYLSAQPTIIHRTSASLKDVGLKRSQSVTHQCLAHKGRWEMTKYDRFRSARG